MRVKHWRTRLFEVIEEARGMNFVWGTNDCAQFAGRCIEAMTGTHPWPDLVGSYADEAGAVAKLAELNVIDVEGFAARYLPRITGATGADAPLLALDGDVGIIMQGCQKTLTICSGPRCIGPGVRHLMMVPRSRMICAFRVI